MAHGKSLAEQIQNDMKVALLGGDRFVGETLRNLKAAILNEEVATNKRNESIALYEQNDRPELAEVERKEAAVLATYLPTQLTEEQIREIAKTVIEGMSDVGPSMMGQVIGGVKAKAGTSADGATIARVVKELLNS